MFFRDVIGHKELVETLVSSVKSGRMGHALLFAGSNGCGSLALALGLARYVLCTGGKTSDACGECPSCRKMDKFVHPDLHFVFPVWLKEASSVSDDFIREWRLLLSEGAYFDSGLWGLRLNAENKQLIIPAAESGSILGKLSLKAFESDFKIMLIWLPEKMNLEASNALLKIVEEPYEKTFFFLVTENLPAILPTIRSRTQIIHVPRIETSDIKDKLIRESGLPEIEAETYAHAGCGNWQKVCDMLNEPEDTIYNREHFIGFMRLCWQRKMPAVNAWVEEISGIGRERLKRFLHYGIRMIRENFMANFKEERLLYMTPKEKEFSKRFSPYMNEKNVVLLYREFEKAYREVEMNGNSKIILTDLCIVTMQNIHP